MIPYVIPLKVGEPKPIPVQVDTNQVSIQTNLETAIQIVTGEHYHGQVEFTPSEEAQAVHVEGLFVDEPIIIDAIPSDYAKMTWNGTTLMLS